MSAPVIIDDSLGRLTIGGNMEYLKDPSGALTIEAITGEPLDWRKSSGDSFNFGFTSSAYWFRFRVETLPAGPREWYLEVDYSLLDRLELYVDEGAGVHSIGIAGDLLPFSKRDVPDRNFIFRQKSGDARNEYYLRIQTSSSLNFTPIIWSTNAFVQRLNTQIPILWLYNGLMIVMAVYNLLFYLSIRERRYLFYGLMIASWTLLQMALSGLAAQYLWPENVWWANQCIPLLVSSTVVWTALFACEYMNTRESFPSAHRFFCGSIVIANAMGIAAALVFDYARIIQAIDLMALVSVLTIYMFSLYFMANGSKTARSFVISFTLAFISLTIYIFKSLGLLPATIITNYSILAGTSFVVIMLSLGLANRINAMKDETVLLNRDLMEANKDLTIFKRFAQASGQGLGVTNLDGKFVFGNSAFCRLLGFASPRELMGIRAGDLYPEKWRVLLRTEIRRRVLEEGEWMGELVIRTKNGKEIPVLQNAFLIRASDQSPEFFATVLTDITNAKAAEEEIRKLNEKLESRVIERTTQLETANRALQESLETINLTQTQLVQSEKMAALGGLVAGVAHEINTPLGVAITAATLLGDKTQEQYATYANGNLTRSELEKYMNLARESAAMIQRNLDRAADLVRSFKQVAVDQTTEQRRRFNVHRYIDELLFSLRPRLNPLKHVIRLTCPEEIEINSFPGVFSQIITNLVMNSLIHGFENIESGEIAITVWTEDNKIVLCYTDNGRGMESHVLERMCEPFYTTRRSQGGTGLGMHILYNLVTQTLNGTIEFTSAPWNGVFFMIRIPLSD